MMELIFDRHHLSCFIHICKQSLKSAGDLIDHHYRRQQQCPSLTKGTPPFLHQFSSVQSLTRVRLFVTPWTAVHQDSMSITNSQSLHKFMSIELVMPSSHLILCHPLLLLPSILPASGSFPKSEFFASRGQKTGTSASSSVLPMNTQDWSPLGLTGMISLQYKGLWRVFSNTKVQNHQFFSGNLSLWSNSHIHTWLLEKP